MFTGLIEDIGTLAAQQRAGSSSRLVLRTALPLAEVAIGDSIAVDGACLTVVRLGRGEFEADASHETLERTTLGARRPGARLHLERALRYGARLDGHLVQGHVDATGSVRKREQRGDAWDLEFAFEAGTLEDAIVEKGSIAVDGVSLTVNACGPGWLGVTIVPHTVTATTLLDRRVGERVNLETDILGKYVAGWLARRRPDATRGGVDLEFLRRHGFGT